MGGKMDDKQAMGKAKPKMKGYMAGGSVGRGDGCVTKGRTKGTMR